MLMENALSRSLRLMLTGGLVAASHAALAQDVLPRVEITGSSIKRIASEGALPVLLLSQEDIKTSGATNAAELIQSLPSMQNFANTAASVNGGGAGTTTASIHTIGAEYTLVLLNGRRMASFGSGSAVNLGSIPLAAIERIEVLTDGASTLYGSDAIAGVINFILKKNQTALVVEGNFSAPQHTGGKGSNLSLSKGFGELAKDGYNLLLSYSHDEQKPLEATDRPYANTGVRKFSEGGKDYYLYQLVVNTAPASAGLAFNQPVRGQQAMTFSPDFLKNGKCDVNTYPVRDLAGGTSCWYDYGATVQLIPESQRDSLFASFTKQLGANTTLFAEAVASRFELRARFAPGAQRLALPLDDPLYAAHVRPYLAQLGIDPANVARAQINLRLTDAGGRTNRYVTDARHLVLGLEGSLMGWDYNSAYTRSKSAVDLYYDGGYLSSDKYRALRASGQYNPFAPTGASAEVLAPAVLHGLTNEAESVLDIVNLRASNALFEMGGGKAQLGAGADLTRQRFVSLPSPIAQGPNLLQPGFTDTALGGLSGMLPTDSTQKSYGVFAEMLMPISKTFDLTAAVRYDDYKAIESAINVDLGGRLSGPATLGNANSKATYKLAASLRPRENVLLRASYGSGFKNPTMINVVAPLAYAGVTPGKYPCPVAPPNPLAKLCQGNTQYDLIRGGNPLSGDNGLKPEQSKQGTLGIRIEPVAELSLGLDFWDIKMRDQIANMPEALLFGQAASFQGLFSQTFNAGQGQQILVGALTPLNLSTSHYQGIDWDHSVRGSTPAGKLKVAWTGTWTHRAQSEVPGVGVVKSLGRFDENNLVALRWQSKLAATLSTSARYAHTLSAQWRSGYEDQKATVAAGIVLAANADGSMGAPVDLTRKVKDYATFDWQTRVSWTDKIVLTAGIRNLADKEPSFSIRTAGGGNQIGYDGRYSDPIGRLFYLKGSLRF